MLRNFQLAAIVKRGRQTSMLRIPMHQQLQQSLATSWHQQHGEFTSEIEEIQYDPGYEPEKHERFCLQEYEPPDWLQGENSRSAANLDAITRDDDLLESIRGIAAFAKLNRKEVVLFQNFSRGRVIHPERFLFLQNNTYTSMARPGLTLDTKLSAVLRPHDKELVFHSFRSVNTFLPLSDFYKEASADEIRQVLDHQMLAPQDADALAENSNQWFRKRFAMLRDSGVLEEYSAADIVAHSEGYEVNIQLDGDQIIFPSERSEAKRLLQFLNEEIYRGAITDTLYETNSKREADQDEES